MESLFGSLKQELADHTPFDDRDDVRAPIFDYIEAFYNRQRSHPDCRAT
jgi:putative transposase